MLYKKTAGTASLRCYTSDHTTRSVDIYTVGMQGVRKPIQTVQFDNTPIRISSEQNQPCLNKTHKCVAAHVWWCQNICIQAN